MTIGLFGKLPARGDFVSARLPSHFVQPWDTWLQHVLHASQQSMGTTAWLPAWLEAPIWRFTLAPGLCGAYSALGVLVPSVDRVGRYFPLTVASVHAQGAPTPEAADPWLDACEQAALAALEQDLTPEQVLALIPAEIPHPGPPSSAGVWWTSGAPRVPATRLNLAHLPDAACFCAMLGGRPGALPLDPAKGSHP